MSQLSKSKKWLLAIGLLVIVAVGVSIAVVHLNHATPDKTSQVALKSKPHKVNPYKNLPAKQQKIVKVADQAVAKAITAKADNQAADVINQKVTTAANQIAQIKGTDATTTAIRNTYTDVLNVVKNPTVDNLQTARTAVSLLKDSSLSEHLTKTYEAKLIRTVATVTHQSTKAVRNASKPLTAAQEKAKEAKAKALAVAKAKAAADAKAKADAAAKAQAQAAATAAQNNAATTAQANTQTSNQVAGNTTSNQTQGQTTYSAPQQSTSTQSTYTAPKQSTTTQASQTPATSSSNSNAQNYVKVAGPTVDNNSDLPQASAGGDDNMDWYELK